MRHTPALEELTHEQLLAYAKRSQEKLALAHNRISRLRSAIKALERAVERRNAALTSGLGVRLSFYHRVAS